MYNNVKREMTRGGNQMFIAKSTLLDDCFFEPELKDYSIRLLDLIRKSFAAAMPGLSEKFNTGSLYFGYSLGEADDAKDKAYIYVQKKKLVIDLHIKPSYADELEQEGFIVKQRDNFQSQQGDWLTGWQVPHSSEDVELILKWLCKAFERKS